MTPSFENRWDFFFISMSSLKFTWYFRDMNFWLVETRAMASSEENTATFSFETLFLS